MIVTGAQAQEEVNGYYGIGRKYCQKRTKSEAWPIAVYRNKGTAHKLLFDLGSDGTLFENVKKRAIELSKIDTVIISHGQNLIKVNQEAEG